VQVVQTTEGITTYEVDPARFWWAMPLLFGENVHVTYSERCGYMEGGEGRGGEGRAVPHNPCVPASCLAQDNQSNGSRGIIHVNFRMAILEKCQMMCTTRVAGITPSHPAVHSVPFQAYLFEPAAAREQQLHQRTRDKHSNGRQWISHLWITAAAAAAVHCKYCTSDCVSPCMP
jgi:hypothetical protein